VADHHEDRRRHGGRRNGENACRSTQHDNLLGVLPTRNRQRKPT
jgi:hypothetical protein